MNTTTRFFFGLFLAFSVVVAGIFLAPSQYMPLCYGLAILALACVIFTERKHKYYFEDGKLAIDTERPLVRLGPVTWSHDATMQHFLITGATGTGKTTRGFLPLIHSFLKNHPQGGALLLDQKGHLWRDIEKIARALNRENDLIVVRVRRKIDEPLDHTNHRYNILSDRALPWEAHAKNLVEIATALDGKDSNKQAFFKNRATAHLVAGMELLEELSMPITVRTLYDTITNRTELASAIERLNELEPNAKRNRIDRHFESIIAQEGGDQVRGEIDTIKTYLQYFLAAPIEEVFSSPLPNTFEFSDLDKGKMICLSIPQEFGLERKAMNTFFKVQTFNHGLRRFDIPLTHDQRMCLPRILVGIDEFQEIVTVSGGTDDISATNRLREAGMFCVFATLSDSSLLPAFGKEHLTAFLNNCRNRIAFKAPDELCAKNVAERITKTLKARKSVNYGSMGWLSRQSITLQEQVEWILRPDEIEGLPNFYAVIVKADARKGKYWRGKLPFLKIKT